MFYVYILQWAKNYYIGYTSNLKLRYEQHLSWTTPTTSKMKDLHIVGYFEKQTKTEAIKLERMIKRNGHIDHRISHPTFIKWNGDCSSAG